MESISTVYFQPISELISRVASASAPGRKRMATSPRVSCPSPPPEPITPIRPVQSHFARRSSRNLLDKRYLSEAIEPFPRQLAWEQLGVGSVLPDQAEGLSDLSS